MDEFHQRILRSNHCLLLYEIDYRRLLPYLDKYKIFGEYGSHIYEKCERRDKINMLLSLPHKGPDAFDNFILALRDSNHGHIADKLLGLPDELWMHRTTRFLKKPLPKPMDLRTERLRIEVVPSVGFKDDFGLDPTPYTMRSKTRGAVLIINNKIFRAAKARMGAQVDQENLQELFRQMGGYDVTLKEDRTAAQMQRDILEFSKSNHFKDVNVVFVIIMSHGSDYVNEAQVRCVDEQFVRTSWIESQFHGDNCPYMQNKPKIIVYQICRGADLDIGVRSVETDGVYVGLIPTRRHADMLICHSTSQGFMAHRDTELGSWYIQYLCEVFMHHAHCRDVGTMLHLVDDYLRLAQSDDVVRSMQTPTFTNNGFRLCYLNPGIYEENHQLRRYTY